MTSEHFGVNVSTSGINASTYGCLTKYCSSSLVINEDVSTVTSIISNNGCTNKENSWERCYDQDNESYYFSKIGKRSVWVDDPRNKPYSTI